MFPIIGLYYWPVSLTIVACKIAESLIRDHIIIHFISNSLFSSKQFGFIKGRSTILQLLHVLDSWVKNLEGGQIDVIYMDFAKAFDKVPHCRKLYSYGISDQLILWIKDLLLHKSQRVKINNEFSAWHSVISGIPQGSVLGSLLFVIFTNDLPDTCSDFAEIFLFTDDAKLFRHVKYTEDSAVLQRSCDRLFQWSNQRLLRLNVDKCKVLSIGLRNTTDFTYYLGDVNDRIELERTSSMKDLGVIIDCKLKFQDHIKQKINKANSMLGIIRRNFKEMDVDSFVCLYKVFVRRHLEYAESVWNPQYMYLIDDLEKVQKQATKNFETV